MSVAEKIEAIMDAGLNDIMERYGNIEYANAELFGNYEEERSFVAEEHGNEVGIAVEIGGKRIDVEYYPIEDYWQILENGVIIEAKE